MKKNQTHLSRYWPDYAIGFGSATVLTSARLLFPNGFDWAAWVQAVGSIAAILVAVVVSSRQSKWQEHREELRDVAEMTGILRSIRAELESTLEFSRKHIGEHISESARGMPIHRVFPMADDPFPIYTAFTPQLGKVTPDSRRQELVSAFASARSFVSTVRYHNQMVEEFNQAVSAARTKKARADDDEREIAQHLTSLADYSDSLRGAFAEAMAKGDKLLEDLRGI